MAKKETKASGKAANRRSAEERKKNIPFAVAVGVLSLGVVVSVLMFVISVFLHGESQQEFTKSLYPVKYEYFVESYAKEFDVDVCLVYGVMRTESGFDPNAVSQAGAIGLMQIMPDTFTWLQNYRSGFTSEKLLDSKELYKPKVNIEYGTFMLHYLLDHYNGNTSLAIIAYNAGYGNVDSWLADGTISQNVTSESVPFPETSNYLTRVTEAMKMYRSLYYDEIGYYSDSDAAIDSGSTEDDINSEFDSDIDTDTDVDIETDIYGDDGSETIPDYDYGDDEYSEW